ncbi:MAG: hypothetical protein JSS81_14545 [Acidobacteria bacterium]|nr:hypothetical protein [Acidobacteriota bacterium]
MGRIILGALAGFVIWAILWIGSDMILMALSPGWYGRNMGEFQAAMENKTVFTLDSLILIISLIRSVVFSLIAGFAAAWIARENTKAPLGTGILLLLFGIFVQSVYWNYLPLWYHLTFLILLVPVTIFGGKQKSRKLLV